MNLSKIKKIENKIKPTKLLIVTKYSNTEDLKPLIDNGYLDFGENRSESILEKMNILNDDRIRWHFIGHLQRNKCKSIINKISSLHSLESLKLAEMINKERTKPLDTYIEVKLVENDSKYGVLLEDLECFIENLKKYPKINVKGLMVMTDKDMTKEEKKHVFMKACALNKIYGFKELSMGMSDDYKIAIECGATIVRLGSILL